MKAILDENEVITIYPESVAEMIVLQYMNEDDDKKVVLSEKIYKEKDNEN